MRPVFFVEKHYFKSVIYIVDLFHILMKDRVLVWKLHQAMQFKLKILKSSFNPTIKIFNQTISFCIQIFESEWPE